VVIYPKIQLLVDWSPVELTLHVLLEIKRDESKMQINLKIIINISYKMALNMQKMMARWLACVIKADLKKRISAT